MQTTHIYKILIFFVTLTACSAELSVRPFIESSYLIRGEVTELVIETNKPLESLPQISKSADYSLTYKTNLRTRAANNRTVFQYRYNLSSFTLGTHAIPPFTVALRDEAVTTYSQPFAVFPSSKLTFANIKVGNRDIRYATALFLPERELYVGETVPAELKVYLPYLPSHYSVIDLGVPELKRDGISAWRFQTDAIQRAKSRRPTPFLLPSGSHFALTYKSSAHAMRSGELTLGGGNIRPVFKAVSSKNGQTTWADLPTYLPVSKTTHIGLPLPSNAPESFNGAVGQFKMEIGIDNMVRKSPTDPINAILTITGQGNLDKITPPTPLQTNDSWKLYPAKKTERAGERRYRYGSIEFSQLLRPLTSQKQLPPFLFTYFDPAENSYITLESLPIPLMQSVSTAPETKPSEEGDKSSQSSPSKHLPVTSESDKKTPTKSMPRESMTSVLGALAPPYKTENTATTLTKYWHIIPCIIIAYLLIIAFRRHLLPKFAPSAERKQALTAVHRLNGLEDHEWIKEASSISQRFLTETSQEKLISELAKVRDLHCYAKEQSQPFLSKEKKSQFSKDLKNAIKHAVPILLMVTLLCSTSSLKAETTPKEPFQDAWQYIEEENYQLALAVYLSLETESLPSDILYNIGICYANLEEPGQAILYFRRALTINPSHQEAKQNLRYLERVNGSIVIKRKGFINTLSYFPRSYIHNLMWLLIWAFIISSLSLALYNNKSVKAIMVPTFVIAVLLLPLSFLSLYLYPNDGKHYPPETLAVITSPEGASAKTAATNTAGNVIKAPPGSISNVIKQRGLWAYIEFANGTRGWINTKHITMLNNSSQALKDITPVKDTPDL